VIPLFPPGGGSVLREKPGPFLERIYSLASGTPYSVSDSVIHGLGGVRQKGNNAFTM
jgi:hypothetical protein